MWTLEHAWQRSSTRFGSRPNRAPRLRAALRAAQCLHIKASKMRTRPRRTKVAEDKAQQRRQRRDERAARRRRRRGDDDDDNEDYDDEALARRLQR